MNAACYQEIAIRYSDQHTLSETVAARRLKRPNRNIRLEKLVANDDLVNALSHAINRSSIDDQMSVHTVTWTARIRGRT